MSILFRNSRVSIGLWPKMLFSAKKCSPISHQAGTKRRDWAIMIRPMYFKWWWMIIRYFCDSQQHVGRCSGLKNIWILEPHRLPISALFPIIYTSLRGAICCHQHHGVIWILNSMNMKVLDINYSRNVISIAHLLPRIGSVYGANLTYKFWFLVPTRRRRKIPPWPQSTLQTASPLDLFQPKMSCSLSFSGM